MIAKSPEREFQLSLAKNITLVATIVAAVVALVLSKLDLLTPDHLQQLILALVVALAVSEVLKSMEGSAWRDEIQRILASVGRIELSQNSEVVAARFPERIQDYVNLWGGFNEHYFAFNPAYRVEARPGIDPLEVVKAVFIPRFRDREFKKGHYLFLTGDQEGRDDLDTFRGLMTEVKDSCPGITSKLEVRELKDRPASAEEEFYLGTKQGTQTSIVELKERALSGGRGWPAYYLVITDEVINEKLKEHFDRSWKQAVVVDVFSGAPGAAPSVVP